MLLFYFELDFEGWEETSEIKTAVNRTDSTHSLVLTFKTSSETIIRTRLN